MGKDIYSSHTDIWANKCSLPDCDGEVMPTGRGVANLQGKKEEALSGS